WPKIRKARSVWNFFLQPNDGDTDVSVEEAAVLAVFIERAARMRRSSVRTSRTASEVVECRSNRARFEPIIVRLAGDGRIVRPVGRGEPAGWPACRESRVDQGLLDGIDLVIGERYHVKLRRISREETCSGFMRNSAERVVLV